MLESGAREMPQQLRAYTALAENPSLTPGSHAECLTNDCNSSIEESDSSELTSPLMPTIHTHILTHKYAHN